MSAAVWYYSQNLKPQGPHTLEEMRLRMHRGEVGPQDLVLHTINGDWKPAMNHKEFEVSLFPALQSYDAKSKNVMNEKEWVLLVTGPHGAAPIQEGPFSIHDFSHGLRQKKYSGEEYIWKPGLSGWCRMKDRPELFPVIEKVLLESI